MRFLVLTLVLTASAAAQPASQRLADAAPPDVLTLAVAGNDALAARAVAARTGGPAPVRFAEPVAVAVTPASAGTWSEAGDGTRVWRLVVSSPTAYSLSFGFSRFRLPEGAALWVYAEGQAPEYRPFTADDNEAHGQLWTPIVVGDRAVIELNVPPSKTPLAVDLELTQANHAFLPTLLSREEKDALGARLSGSCNVDVACPEGDAYPDIIRSVGAYTVRGVDYCSGAAINTTAGDNRPIFLTAEHCGINAGNGPDVVVYWNYQNSTCRTPGSPSSGQPGDGPRSMFNSGVAEIGDGAAADWSVLEFDDPIPAAAAVFLAGWDRRDLAPASAVAIHHPQVEEKRISFENDPLSITAYSSPIEAATGTHLRVADWDLGTTEGGSSGSPLFNPDGRIIGQLSGGFAACGNDDADWYGRTYRAMNDGLAAILDPLGTGAQTLDGADYAASPTAGAEASTESTRPGEDVTFTFTVTNPTADDVTPQFTNVLPVGLLFAGDLQASIGTASLVSGAVTWSDRIPAGGAVTISYLATIADDAAGTIENTAATTFPGFADAIASASVFVDRGLPTPDIIVETTVGLDIPDAGCPTAFQSTTLDVSGTLVIDHLAVGVNIDHTWRGDLRLRLTSPQGTTVALIDRVGPGEAGTSADNLDVLIADGGMPNAFSGGDHDIGAPFYDVVGAPESGSIGGPVGALAAFVGEGAAGTWTLEYCDAAGRDKGSLERWSLQFVGAGGIPNEDSPEASFSARIAGPNPARTRTALAVTVLGTQRVRATLVDATGRTVAEVFDGPVSDSADLGVEVGDLAAGVYLVRVEAGTRVQTRRLTVVR